ncbi:hypothetical protein [Mucilaginibacter sp. 21P]|nr:hypothetical protein [Mucilaginibacter sp. 21P]
MSGENGAEVGDNAWYEDMSRIEGYEYFRLVTATMCPMHTSGLP